MSIAIPIVVASANVATATTINPNIAIIVFPFFCYYPLFNLYVCKGSAFSLCAHTNRKFILFFRRFIDINQESPGVVLPIWQVGVCFVTVL